jgi:hypothetical protein
MTLAMFFCCAGSDDPGPLFLLCHVLGFLVLGAKDMFDRAMQIEKNVARIEHNSGDYRIIVTVEHREAATITQDEAQMLLTNEWQFLFTQKVRFGG